MKFAEKTPPLKAETFLSRLLYCVGLLNIHGFLTDAERKKVFARLGRHKRKENKVMR